MFIESTVAASVADVRLSQLMTFRMRASQRSLKSLSPVVYSCRHICESLIPCQTACVMNTRIAQALLDKPLEAHMDQSIDRLPCVEFCKRLSMSEDAIKQAV